MAGLVPKNAQRLGKTTTVGVMVDWLGDPYQTAVLSGMMEGAATAGANLLCFVGNHLPLHPEENARHRIYGLISLQNVDGLVALSTSLMHEVGLSGIQSYYESHFIGVPVCSFGADVPGYPCITSNNQYGIKEIVSHLVRQHGRSRIAFVRGPLNNEEAERRYEAYVEALGENQLQMDPRLVFVGDFMRTGGANAVQKLTQASGLSLDSIDAIVASNDNTAIGVLEALEKHDVAVPASISVTGYDDVEDAQTATPALTTVRQPLTKMGHEAVRVMVRWIQEGTVPSSIVVNTEVILRQSCGCLPSVPRSSRVIIPPMDRSFEAAIVVGRQPIIDSLTRAARGELGSAGKDWQSRLLNAFIAELRGETSGVFSAFVMNLVRKRLTQNSDIQVCHDVVDALRKHTCGMLRTDPDRRDKAEDLFYLAQKEASEVLHRDLVRGKAWANLWVRDVSYACTSIAGAFNQRELEERVRHGCAIVGIETFFIALYSAEHGIDRGELIMGRDQGRDITLPTDRWFDVPRLLPSRVDELIRGGRAFAVLPLAWKGVIHGHMLVELNLERAVAYGAIAEAIAVGLQGARFANRTLARATDCLSELH